MAPVGLGGDGQQLNAVRVAEGVEVLVEELRATVGNDLLGGTIPPYPVPEDGVHDGLPGLVWESAASRTPRMCVDHVAEGDLVNEGQVNLQDLVDSYISTFKGKQTLNTYKPQSPTGKQIRKRLL